MEDTFEGQKCTSNRVVLVGIGGGSCSGKTTLAKGLQSILPDCFLLHQDDFGPPPNHIPNHPIHNVPDWEDPETAMDWPKLIECLQDVKKRGALPGYVKHEGWVGGENTIQLSSTTLNRWNQVFKDLAAELATKSIKITWGIVEGFVLYWHKDVVKELDVRLFLRGNHDAMKVRRESRGSYQALGGYVWSDPPNYWENVVWPAYLKAHNHLFVDGDINGDAIQVKSDNESQTPSYTATTTAPGRGPVTGLIVLPAEDETLEGLVEISCIELKAFQTVLIEE